MTQNVNSDGQRPPPWRPFGKAGAATDTSTSGALKGFKSLHDPKKEDMGPDAFAEQRKQVVKQIVKEGTGTKVRKQIAREGTGTKVIKWLY